MRRRGLLLSVLFLLAAAAGCASQRDGSARPYPGQDTNRRAEQINQPNTSGVER